MYASRNFRTKKALKDAVAMWKAGNGPAIEATQPGPFPAKTDGAACIEGPWYPEPHKWYAAVTLEHGIIVKVSR